MLLSTHKGYKRPYINNINDKIRSFSLNKLNLSYKNLGLWIIKTTIIWQIRYFEREKKS